jgi:prepilin-type N-terminal cleavage/methylation domain-containing protein
MSLGAKISSGCSSVSLAGNNGVSLAEMLVAVALIAILSGLAAPSFSDWIQTRHLRKTMRQIVTDLQFARMRTLSEGMQYRINFGNSGGCYAIEKGDKPADSQVWTPVGIARQFTDKTNPYFARGVSLSQNFPQDRATFSPNGASSMGTIKISTGSCGDGTTSCKASPKRPCEKCITTLLTGRVAIAQ